MDYIYIYGRIMYLCPAYKLMILNPMTAVNYHGVKGEHFVVELYESGSDYVVKRRIMLLSPI